MDHRPAEPTKPASPPSRRSPLRWGVGIAGAAVIALAAWAVIADAPFVTAPRGLLGCDPAPTQAPRFLDEQSPAVTRALAAANESCERGEAPFYTALNRAMTERFHGAEVPGPWNRMAAFETEEAQDHWRDARSIDVLTFDPWPVPETPTWAEDPYEDLSWLRTYHSLGWLNAPAALYASTGEQRYAEDVAHYALAWIRLNPPDRPPSRRSWYDGAVALRTDTIVSHLPLLLEVLEPPQLEEVLRSLDMHGRRLSQYLRDERWYAHNHNLFHALSLHNLATQVPELRRAEQWQASARERIATLQREMVDGDGVSTEQAANYHYTAIRWFSVAERYLSDRGIELSGEERDLLTAMTRFGALLPDPSGRLPAIGDTRYGAMAPWSLLETLAEDGGAHPEAEFVLSRGALGSRPADLITFPQSGYAIMRPSYGEAGAWEDDLHVVVDMGPYRRVHGHNDAMNVLLSAHGAPLLVDSGGPYAYGIPRRGDYLHAAAHNTVVIDGADHREGGVPEVTLTQDGEQFSAVEGRHEPVEDVLHTRGVIVLKPALVLVVDWLESDSGSRTYELLWNLDPNAQLTRSADGLTATVDSASIGITIAGSEDGVRRQVRAGEAGSPVGWVTTRHRRQQEAPTFSATQRGRTAWFVTALRPAEAERGGQAVLEIASEGDALEVRVDGGEGAWQLRLEPGRAPVVLPP